MSNLKSGCQVNRQVWNTLTSLGFSNHEAQQAIDHADTKAGPEPPLQPRVSCSKIFRYLDEKDKEEKEDLDYSGFQSGVDECQMVFIVPPNYGTAGGLAKCVTDSLIIMQEYLSEHDDLFGSYVDKWSMRGNPSSIYTAHSKEHMQSLREQVDIVQLPVITLPCNRRSTSSSLSGQADSISIICVFGPINKINRLVRPLKLLK